MPISTHNMWEFWGQNFYRQLDIQQALYFLQLFTFFLKRHFQKNVKSCFSEIWKKTKNTYSRTLVLWCTLSRQGHYRGAQIHGVHQAASHIPALNLPSCSRYSFTDPKRVEGWVSPGPRCKEQLAHGCYGTTRGQLDLNPDLAIFSAAS